MNENSFLRVYAFLKGASWAFVSIGALLVFKFFISFDLILAVFTSFIFVFFALFLLFVLDGIYLRYEQLKEVKKQTKLLEEISSQSQQNPEINQF